MAIRSIDFSVINNTPSDPNRLPYATGSLSVDEASGSVVDVSGSADGRPIDGISVFNGADNKVNAVGDFTRQSHYDVSQSGVGFTAGGFSYNLSGLGSRLGSGVQTNVTLVRSDGLQRTSSFSAPFRPTVCFATGTRIRTVRGDVAVEDLRVGDGAVTASGTIRPIVWIGHRDLVARGLALPHDQQPIRVRAGAFGPGLPARDLFLSPGHPVLVNADSENEGGHLVPIMCLINGTKILREPARAVTYWHVELDQHDLLLAEGLAAESYLDWGDRPFFGEGSDHAIHNPDFVAPGLSARCRPVAVDGSVVEAERVRLDAVFADYLLGQCAWDEPTHLSA